MDTKDPSRRAVASHEGHTAERPLTRSSGVGFFRDVHDLLGSTLYAVVLRAELAQRLTGIDPHRARAELVELLLAIESALTETHVVGAGLAPNLDLNEELSKTSSLLHAKDVCLRVWGEESAARFPRPLQVLFGLILRESATNVLKHSEATRCSIVLRASGSGNCLAVLNDGASGRVDDSRHRGLNNLAHRVRVHGGRLDVGATRGWFMVRASIPCGADPASPTPPVGSGTAPAGDPLTTPRILLSPAGRVPRLREWSVSQDREVLPATPEERPDLTDLQRGVEEAVVRSLQEILCTARRAAELLETSPPMAGEELRRLTDSARATLAAIRAVVDAGMASRSWRRAPVLPQSGF